MCLGDDNMHAIKRRKLFIPAKYITEYSVFYLHHASRREGRGHPEHGGGTKRGSENPSRSCKFTQLSSTENMETQLPDMLALLTKFQLFSCVQEEISWDKALRSSTTNKV